MDDDLADLDFDDTRKKQARQGRRAAKAPPPPDPVADIPGPEIEESIPPTRQARDSDGPPRPSRRTGGWGETSRRDSEEDIRLRPQTALEDDGDSDPEIPVIPDLEDQQPDEEMTVTIAMAPSVAINRVATYRELDNDLLAHAQFLTLDNEIDLKLLGQCLSAEADVQEADKPWDWDRIFTEVTSELQTEWEKMEGKESEEVDAGA